MTWLFIVIIAYFINAINSIIDKFFLTKPIPNPVVYSFYIGILSITALIFAPFGLVWPGFLNLFFDLLIGVIFVIALIFLFNSLKKGEASIILPIIGAFTPIFIFALSYLFLNERLNWDQIIAFLFLVLGGILASISKIKKGSLSQLIKYSIKTLETAILAALIMALFYVLVKFAYINQPFISAFIWTRIGSFMVGLLLFILPKSRKIILKITQNLRIKMGGLFILNKSLSGLAFLLLNYAVFLYSPTMINALQGIQYVFLLLLAIFISKKLPHIIKEEINKFIIMRKILAILLIGAGLIILFI